MELTALPNELLAQIFENLASIDDVHYLGRCCKATYEIIRDQSAYVKIMRSVIRHSQVHRFDIQLCQMLDVHNTVVSHFQMGGLPFIPTPLSHRGLSHTNVSKLELDLAQAINDNEEEVGTHGPTKLTDGRIYDILARWQGLRVLRDLWLARQLKREDYLTLNAESPTLFSQAFEKLVDRHWTCPDKVPARFTFHDADYITFNPDQYARFYAATTNLWLMNEIRWVLTHYTHPTATFHLPLVILDSCRAKLASQTQTPLLDDIDKYAVYTFLYQHLLPLHLTVLSDQCSSKLPLTYSSDSSAGRSTHSARLMQLCLLAGQTYLQPPDIIELAVRNAVKRKPPYPDVYPPPSTMTHLRPNPQNPFPPRRSLTSDAIQLAPIIPNQQPLDPLVLTHVRIMQRASFAQTYRAPAAPVLPRTAPRSLYRVLDLQDHLEDRVKVEFDLHAGPGKPDIMTVLHRRLGSEVRWGVWWWANSEVKARMKMERWR
ncbi:hypothetical protein K491DRAFT_647843 [Lophiostoma macrostomum CBS 122681]|uniref:F-box domain-containing protein n=1 Tax=Lophiostoma macrostomum CBS 122681 TaxID=1314788 RepID=A0A6A6TNT5_9PLEO|nr:hypothetical protein K491DRAFT_647843 [Lophiostoma macrostomum CBS 122681]